MLAASLALSPSARCLLLPTQVPQDLLLIAAGFFEGIRQDQQPLGVERAILDATSAVAARTRFVAAVLWEEGSPANATPSGRMAFSIVTDVASLLRRLPAVLQDIRRCVGRLLSRSTTLLALPADPLLVRRLGQLRDKAVVPGEPGGIQNNQVPVLSYCLFRRTFLHALRHFGHTLSRL